ncbi:MAG TPA: metallophosphoesterase N-terminal domain-containing protein, partial [Segetibacter sp.]
MERRNFLKSFGLAGTALVVPATITKAVASTGKKDLANLILRGKVQSNGKGIAGVAVTDGINVTVTDNAGNYELLSNNTAEFVYISVPAGYKIPHDKGIAKFYVPITQKGSFKADFNLEKLKVDD